MPVSKRKNTKELTTDEHESEKSDNECHGSPKLKGSKKPLLPIMDSEKAHEKSRNSLWEAFMTKDTKEPKSVDATSENIKESPKEEGSKKNKIGVTIKKSPNSDRTFESRLLNQELENMSLKNKHLDIW